MRTLILVFVALLALLACVEARSVAQIKAEVVASQQALPDAPVGATVADLQKYSKKKISRVLPTGIGAQLPGDKENNEDAIHAVKFDLRWAKSIKQKHLNEGVELVPKTDRVNEKFLDMQAKNTRLPLIAPHLFND